MELVFSELTLCELIDDCDTITVDADGILKCFDGKPIYVHSLGKWVLDSDGKTRIIGQNYGSGIYKDHSFMIIKYDGVRNFIMKDITYPLQGVNCGLDKGLSISVTKNLVKGNGYDITTYRFNNNYTVNLGDNDYVYVKSILEIEIDTLGNYDLRIPENKNDNYLEVKVSNPRHKQYIIDNYDYIYSGSNDAFIINGDEYNDIINSIIFNYSLVEVKKIVERIGNKYE